MNVSLVVFVFAAFVLDITSSARKDYSGYKLLSVKPYKDHQVHLLSQLQDLPEISLWSGASKGQDVRFSLGPHSQREVIKKLRASGLEPDILIGNLQRQIDLEYEFNNIPDGLDFNAFKYNRHSDINAHMASLADQHEFCSVISIGKSYEGRDMKVLKIAGKNTTNSVWIDGGIHAREWIAPATTVYLIKQLVDGYYNDPTIRRLVETITWYMLPVANPDGYEYTFTTVEADNMAKFLKANQVQLYLALHSYGQMVLVPWSYTEKLPEDYPELEAIGKVAAAAIKRTSGKTYRVGTSPKILYATSGAADDWAKGVAGAKYSYTIELRDTGINGFLLPPTQIEPTGKEIWAAVSAMVQALWK